MYHINPKALHYYSSIYKLDNQENACRVDHICNKLHLTVEIKSTFLIQNISTNIHRL